MATVKIILNLLFLTSHGFVSGAWTTLTAFSVKALSSWVLARSFFTLPSLGKVFLVGAGATATMVVELYLSPSTLGIVWLSIKISVDIAIYAVLAWAIDIAGFHRLLKV